MAAAQEVSIPDDVSFLSELTNLTVRRHWEVAKVRLFQNIKAQG